MRARACGCERPSRPEGLDKGGSPLIRRGKTDAEGQGRVADLSRQTLKWLKIWVEHADISDGPIRRLIGRDQIGDVLHPGSITPIFKRVAQWIGMPARSGMARAAAATGRDESVSEEG